MKTTDVCSLDEFKNTDECKNKSHNLTEDIFWAMVLISIAFFTTTWSNLFNRLLNWIYGSVTSNTELLISAGISLTILLIFTQFFDVKLNRSI
jgi:hypothetical protein